MNISKWLHGAIQLNSPRGTYKAPKLEMLLCRSKTWTGQRPFYRRSGKSGQVQVFHLVPCEHRLSEHVFAEGNNVVFLRLTSAITVDDEDYKCFDSCCKYADKCSCSCQFVVIIKSVKQIKQSWTNAIDSATINSNLYLYSSVSHIRTGARTLTVN